MTEPLQPHQERIQKIGKVLTIFVICWMILNTLGLLTVLGALAYFRFAGAGEHGQTIVDLFSKFSDIPGIDSESFKQIVQWDYQSFLDHFWFTFILALFSTAYFIATMSFILKIAAAMRAGDVLSDSAIKSMTILGWLYLFQGILGQLTGIFGQFIGETNTCEVVFFSFIRDTCLYSFSYSGTGIEWGMLLLAISWTLKHARLMRDEQLLVV